MGYHICIIIFGSVGDYGLVQSTCVEEHLWKVTVMLPC